MLIYELLLREKDREEIIETEREAEAETLGFVIFFVQWFNHKNI